jgi:RNA polymerase sigma-70 factor (ECF subfamily)
MHGAAGDRPVAGEVGRLVREDGGRLLSCLVAILRDFQLAEDSLQDAVESALVHWQRSGLPDSPAAWLMRTARQETIADERLKLIFVCCHPALDRMTSVALTLRSVAGLTTEEVARAYLVSPDAMAQRLVRARHKIARAGIAYEVPAPEGLGERLERVLAVVYLIFNEGYASSSGRRLRNDLCEEAIRLGRILGELMPNEPEAEGLLALMLLHQSRFNTRAGLLGEIMTLETQDRTGWDKELIHEGTGILLRALRRGRPGAYQLQAAIAAEHAQARTFEETDWTEIALIYDALIAVQPNPVFELNRIVALFYATGADLALKRLEVIAGALSKYQPYHAVRAHLLAEAGQIDSARTAFDAAIASSATEEERAFLAERRNKLA